MLVLSRKQGQKVVIGDGITVTVVSIQGNRVRIGIEAPDHVAIFRAELVGDAEHRPVADEPIVADAHPPTSAANRLRTSSPRSGPPWPT